MSFAKNHNSTLKIHETKNNSYLLSIVLPNYHIRNVEL